MAYFVRAAHGKWELRESRSTTAGPRSHTLATFSVLTPEAIARAQSRATRPLSAGQLRQAARRAGAPVAAPVGDRAVGELVAELSAGHRLRPELARVLIDSLQSDGALPSSNAQAAATWIGVSPQKRGEALRELLLLVDRLPRREHAQRPRFPRIESQPA